MADLHHRSAHTLLTKLQTHFPVSNSTHLIGLLTLVVSAATLLVLIGITITLTVIGLIFTLTPILIVSTPLWVPIFLASAWFGSMCGFVVAAVGGVAWVHRYSRGMNPPGSDRVDYARSRIYDTANHVKECAREYGGYLNSKVKDEAPGA